MNSLVIPHDAAWQNAFLVEADQLQRTLEPALQALHHIGSTAIPGILAKPIIDMLAVAHSLDAIDQCSGGLEALGYQPMGAFGIEGRRYFRKSDAAGHRTHHLHVFEAGSPHIQRHLTFRDYLMAHPGKAAEYSGLKSQLEPETYQDAKGPLIARLESEAIIWAGLKRPSDEN